MTRRNTLAALGAAPLAAMAKLAAHSQPKAPDIIRQDELRAMLRLQQQLERGVSEIRRRAEAGATLEHGELGISTLGYESLAVHERYGETGNRTRPISDIAGLDIAPAEEIRSYIDLMAQYPSDALALV